MERFSNKPPLHQTSSSIEQESWSELSLSLTQLDPLDRTRGYPSRSSIPYIFSHSMTCSSRKRHTACHDSCGFMAALVWLLGVVPFNSAATMAFVWPDAYVQRPKVVGNKNPQSSVMVVSSNRNNCDNDFNNIDDDDTMYSSYSSSRRKYLFQLASVAFVPPAIYPACASCLTEEEEVKLVSQEKMTPSVVPQVVSPSIASTETAKVVEPTKPTNTAPTPPPAPAPPVETKAPSPEPKPAPSPAPKPVEAKSATTAPPAPSGKTMEDQGKVVIEEIKREEKDEKKAGQDTDKLIADLKKKAEQAPPRPQVKEVRSTVSAQKSQLEQAQKLIDLETKDLIDQLEAEEEQIEEETLQLMRKVETLEATAERLNRPLLPEPDAANAEDAVRKSEMETNDFLAKLKKRSQDKEAFINLLKQESAAYASGSSDKKLPEFLASLRQTTEADKEFGIILNNFRERLQSRFNAK